MSGDHDVLRDCVRHHDSIFKLVVLLLQRKFHIIVKRVYINSLVVDIVSATRIPERNADFAGISSEHIKRAVVLPSHVRRTFLQIRVEIEQRIQNDYRHAICSEYDGGLLEPVSDV